MKLKNYVLASVVAMFLALGAVGAHAQDTKPSPSPTPAPTISPEKLALINELMELTSSKKTLDEMLKLQTEEMERRLPDEIWRAASTMPELAKLSDLDRESLHLQVVTSALNTSRTLSDFLKQRVDFNKIIIDIAVPLYDKYLTEAELRDLVSFYASPTGKKVIEVMPKLLTESMTQVTDALLPKITEAVMQMQKEETERMRSQIDQAVKAKAKPVAPAKRTTKGRTKH